MFKLLDIKDNKFNILDTDDGEITSVSSGELHSYLYNLGINIQGCSEVKYAFVVDNRGVILSPTKEVKAWYKLRHNQARLLNLNPMVIQLNKEQDNTDNSKFKLGLDPGDITGVAIIQEGNTGSKVIFKGEIQHRKDVSKRVEERKNYRRYHRQHKRYRKPRFNNRASSRRTGRIAPSIKARKDEILRVVRYLNKYVRIDSIYCEDLAFDIKAITDGYKPYKWQYTISNRLDENIRKAVIIRDRCTCRMCKATNTRLEVHHITPRRQGGNNTISNLITLCSCCHGKVTNHEDDYKDSLYDLIDGQQVQLKPAMHVMQGKTYLHGELAKIAPLSLTTGGDTANLRLDLDIPKTHSNDAICITGTSNINYLDTLVYEYKIKPRRKKSNVRQDTSHLDIKHGDLVYYTPRGRDRLKCYVTAILTSGTLAGRYKLKSIEALETFGPISKGSLTKISSNSSLLFA